jgi:hypothetical protein
VVLSTPAPRTAFARNLRRIALAASLAGALALAAVERRDLARWPGLVREAQAALSRTLDGVAAPGSFSAAGPDAPGAASRP